MNSNSRSPRGRAQVAQFLSFFFLICFVLTGAGAEPQFRNPDENVSSVSLKTRGSSDLDKLDNELRVLYEQFTAGRGGPEGHSYSSDQLNYLFGIDPQDKMPQLQVRVTLAEGATGDDIQTAGLLIRGGNGQHVVVSTVVQGLGKLVKLSSVASVDALKAAHTPQSPQRVQPKISNATSVFRGNENLDHGGMTGKGVIVGIVDTGIDWRHGDFLNPDGTTRILYLWDMVDGSYGESDGAIGDLAPMAAYNEALNMTYRYGTLYDADDINQALQGKDTCRSEDRAGHGTACASIAAGNGLSTGDTSAESFEGLAPDADLIICRAGDGSFDNDYVLAVQWIIEKARELGQPCVINLSLGGHFSAHDGHEPVEVFMNDLVGEGIPGSVICASAGNEGRESFHAAVRYGPKSAGQADANSSLIEIFVKEKTELHVLFDADDEWGLAIMGQDNFLVSDEGVQSISYIQKVDGKPDILVPDAIPVEQLIDWARAIQFGVAGSGSEQVKVPLPAGRYYAWAYGASEKVTNGKCDLYLPFTFQGTFGSGTVKEAMVGSPGNADNIITVGSYDHNITWPNIDGGTTRYNMIEGGISGFSNPGFRRDGVVKPDLAAPGRFAISAAAEGSSMKKDAGNSHITPDGLHLAWEGTSASTPYVAGVVALILQKNPNLDAAQVREILIRTAKSDRNTGSTPNPAWGYGKVNSEAAIRATKAP
ncbi:MAG: S8 family serine peptidase [bacterium]|nr:S8 family serine peptidase [bacterium]